MKILLCLAVLLLLGGCVTEEKYIKKFDSWVGRSSADLVREWGKPKKIETLDDHQFFVFYTEYIEYIEYIEPTPNPLPQVLSIPRLVCTPLILILHMITLVQQLKSPVRQPLK